MTQTLVEWVERFCQYQLKQRGKTEGGVRAYRWVLEQFLVFMRQRHGRLARIRDLTRAEIQSWMDHMAAADLTLNTMRCRQSALSSLCAWLVKRDLLATNPIAGMDRPPHRSEPPKQIPTPALMDALVAAAKQRQRPRDLALFLILRYTGMRRESVATLQVRHLDASWGLRGSGSKAARRGTSPSQSPSWLPAVVCRASLVPGARHDRPGNASLLVNLGAPGQRQDFGSHDRKEPLAVVQGLWATHRLPDVEAS